MFKKLVTILLISGFAVHGTAQPEWKHGGLQVTKDGHYLQYEDGTPFFLASQMFLISTGYLKKIKQVSPAEWRKINAN